MDKDTQLWNEYQNLRDEIKSADALNYQILGIIVGGVAAILTTGFSQDDPVLRFFIFLCVYVITIPGYRLLQGNRRRIWRINTYIRVFLEPQLEFVKWLTRLNSQRKKAQSTGVGRYLSSLVITNEWTIITMMNVIAGIVAILVGLLQINLTNEWLIVGIAVIVLLNLWLIFTTSGQEKALRSLGQVEQEYLKSWTELRDQELSIMTRRETK